MLSSHALRWGGTLLALIVTVPLATAQSGASSSSSLRSPFERLPDGTPTVARARFTADVHHALHAWSTQPGPLRLESFPLPHRDVDLKLRPTQVMPEGAHAVVMERRGMRFVQPQVLMFTGSVAGQASTVFLGVSPEICHGYLELDGELYLISSGAKDGTISIAHESALKLSGDPWCKVAAGQALSPPPGGRSGTRGGPSIRVCDVFIECDHQYRGLFGSDQAAIDYATLLVGATSEVYRRDFGATLQIPDQYLRLWNSTPPWGNIGSFNDIGDVQSYWTSNQNPLRDIPRAAVHVLTTPVFGGVAYNIGGVCNDTTGYEISSVFGDFPFPIDHTDSQNWDLFVVAHEFGHTWGSPHTFDYNPAIDCDDGSGPDRGTIMSYCHLDHGVGNVGMRFHTRVQQRVRGRLAAVSCPFELSILPGDYDADGNVDAVDLAALDGFLGQGFESAGVTETFDMNGDGVLSLCDRAILAEQVDGSTWPIYMFTNPRVVSGGDGVELSVCEGHQGRRVMIYVLEVNGSPFVFQVGEGRFSFDGHYSTSGTIPPGLSGVQADFRGFAFASTGKIVISNSATLSIQ